MKLTLPVPNMSALHAHTSGNRFTRDKITNLTKSEATKKAKEQAYYDCLDGINRKELVPLCGKVLISYAFFVPDAKTRDEANMIQACKPYIDGIVKSKLIEGDDWKRMNIYNVTTQIDRKNPRVEITLNSTNGNGDMLSKG
jgi:hypothetical protein